MGFVEQAQQVDGGIAAIALSRALRVVRVEVVRFAHWGIPSLATKCEAQLGEPQAHPTLDRTDGHLQHRGDLGVREPAEVRQLEHAALLLGQAAQGAPDLVGALPAKDLRLGVLGTRHALDGPLFVEAVPIAHPAAAQRVDRAVVHDPQDPVAHAPAAAVVPRASAPQREECLLQDVLGGRAPAAHAVRK